MGVGFGVEVFLLFLGFVFVFIGGFLGFFSDFIYNLYVNSVEDGFVGEVDSERVVFELD